MPLVTLRTFQYPLEITLLKSMLEDSGIPVFIKDEFTILINPLYSNAIGGIKVQVLEEDFEKAIQVLNDFESAQNNPIE